MFTEEAKYSLGANAAQWAKAGIEGVGGDLGGEVTDLALGGRINSGYAVAEASGIRVPTGGRGSSGEIEIK